MPSFSQRNGYKELNEDLFYECMPESLKTRIWNFIHENFLKYQTSDFLKVVCDEFLKYDLTDEWYMDNPITNVIKPKYRSLKWFEVYDLVEFCFDNIKYLEKDKKLTYHIHESSIWTQNEKWAYYLNKGFVQKQDSRGLAYLEYPFEKYLKERLKRYSVLFNTLMEKERASYRLIENNIVPITNTEEINEIKTALNPPEKYKFVGDHLKKALELYSNKEKPDYENSIKESISALESLAKIRLNNEKGTLGRLLPQLGLHEDFELGIKKLYSWTSDDKGGIRHGKKGDTGSYEAEARYMLVTCSTLSNYLISKLEK
ncbi:AbiJ-NTD4 domain-containing protein [Methanococcus maripaludis]|uniref:HEPN AbiJ-N-terminal domain-containing protein n=1 Tax=Methanococcus maripaludis TaxID=39152 RepID=A0A2L1CAB6_METMI|nr:hypothetical protein [Methanococcus maripaludis]AVB76294.1 hypothetical protein MMJJ_08840 [Methanococcus maripaludis]